MTRRRWLLLALATIVVGWAWLAYRDIDEARGFAQSAVASGELAEELALAGDFSGATSALDAASSDLATAADRLDRPTLFPIRIVPYAGTEVRAADATVTAADATTRAAAELLGFLDADRPALLKGSTISPRAFDLLIESLQRAFDHASTARAVLDEAPTPRTRVIGRQLDRVDDLNGSLLEGLAAGTRLAERLAVAVNGGEPYRVLVLFENGAELRATAGLMGFVALVAVDGGELQLEQAQDVHVLQDTDAQGEYLQVAAPADYAGRYGRYLADTTLWLNVNLSPHFPSVAEVATNLYELATGVTPDAVVRLDLVAAGYVLDGFPDLTVEGQALEPGKLATRFLVDSYRRYQRNEDHHEYLAEVFDEIFGHVLEGVDGDVRAVLLGLRRGLDENRLSLYTRDNEVNEALGRAGADGAMLPGDTGDVEVNVQNFGANKIDLYTATAVGVSTETEACNLRGRATVALSNGLPDDVNFLPQGVAGRNGVWWVSFFLPRGATVLALEVDGEEASGSLDPELGRPVASMLVEAEPGSTVEAAVEWREALTTEDYQLRLRAQPHLVPATLDINGDDKGRFVRDRTVLVETDCAPPG